MCVCSVQCTVKFNINKSELRERNEFSGMIRLTVFYIHCVKYAHYESSPLIQSNWEQHFFLFRLIIAIGIRIWWLIT